MFISLEAYALYGTIQMCALSVQTVGSPSDTSSTGKSPSGTKQGLLSRVFGHSKASTSSAGPDSKVLCRPMLGLAYGVV